MNYFSLTKSIKRARHNPSPLPPQKATAKSGERSRFPSRHLRKCPGGGGGEDAGGVETDKQAQQRRLMSLQVGFWVVVLGLFFGLVVCRGRRRRKGARPRTDLLRSY